MLLLLAFHFQHKTFFIHMAIAGSLIFFVNLTKGKFSIVMNCVDTKLVSQFLHILLSLGVKYVFLILGYSIATHENMQD